MCQASATCSVDDFRCGNGKCIPKRWQCDGDDDCHDNSDEKTSTCEAKQCEDNQFSCGPGGMCIPIAWKCDEQNDCPGSEDEANCQKLTCTTEEFMCNTTSKCIAQRWVCDGDNDCGDNSDEGEKCGTPTCQSTELMCNSSGRCVPQRWSCDGDWDCPDGTDEKDCSTTPKLTVCSSHEFACTNRDCIHISWRCDGDSDCTDGSDEKDCKYTECPADHFRCQNGACIVGRKQCDMVPDCEDGSDELDCPDYLPQPCDEETQFDCSGDHTSCVSLEKLCNKESDCPNGEDEAPSLCRNSVDPCNNTVCAGGKCRRKYGNFGNEAICYCDEGFKLMPDQRTCEDINECSIPGTCSQICENTKGHYKCSCHEGYQIDPMKPHYCKAIGEHPRLLFANRHDLREIRLDTLQYRAVVEETQSAIALDFDIKNQMIYYSDILREKIYKAPLTASPLAAPSNVSIEIINDKISTPDGLAYDWIHNNLYWTDTGKNTVEVFDLVLEHRKTLINDKLDEPRALVLDPAHGWMYWTDWGENAKIEKCGMNGRHRQTIVSKDIQWPNGLTIDYVLERLFWVDAKLHIIASSDLLGQNRQVVLASHTHLQHPFAIAVFEDALYWTDWETESIHTTNKFGHKEVKSVAISLFSPMDIHVYHPLKQPDSENVCRFNNGNCSHLCLPAPQMNSFSPKYSCECPDGFNLSSDFRTCIADVNSTTNANATSNPTWKHTDGNPNSRPNKPAVIIQPKTTVEPSIKINVVDESSHPPYVIVDAQNGNAKPKTQASSSSDVGKIAGIVVGIVGVLIIGAAVIGIIVFRSMRRRNQKSMNFDNPVYRKTVEKEDQVSLNHKYLAEENIYQPTGKYPSSLQPLTRGEELPNTEVV